MELGGAAVVEVSPAPVVGGSAGGAAAAAAGGSEAPAGAEREIIKM